MLIKNIGRNKNIERKSILIKGLFSYSLAYKIYTWEGSVPQVLLMWDPGVYKLGLREGYHGLQSSQIIQMLINFRQQWLVSLACCCLSRLLRLSWSHLATSVQPESSRSWINVPFAAENKHTFVFAYFTYDIKEPPSCFVYLNYVGYNAYFL